MRQSARTFLSIFFFILSTSKIYPGFIASTKISTLKGQTAIENLTKYSIVTGYNDEHQILYQTPIEKICTETEDSVVEIITGKETISSSLDQLFYDASAEKFVPAFSLTKNSILIDQEGNQVPILYISTKEQKQLCYDLTLPNPHHYFCGESKVLVHNFAATTSWLASMLEPILGYVAAAVCLYANQPSNPIIDVRKVENILQTYQQKDKVTHKTIRHKSRSITVSSINQPNRDRSPLGEETIRQIKRTIITKPATALSPHSLGVPVVPELYRQIAANRSNFGVYAAVAAVTNKGKIACTLLISELNFRKRTSSGTFLTSWKKIGHELYNLDDPFVKEFVKSEHIRQHNKIVDSINKIKDIHLHIKPFSNNYAKNTRDLEQRYGKLSKTIYGHTFDIHALLNISMHRINPARVIEAIYDGTIIWPENSKPIQCGTGSKKITDRPPLRKGCIQYPANDTPPPRKPVFQMPEKKPMNCGFKLPDLKPIGCGTGVQLLKKENISVTYKPKNKYVLFADIHNPIDDNQVTTVEDLLKIYPEKKDQPKKPKSIILQGYGGYPQAVKDFYRLNPTHVRKNPKKEGLIGVLPDGRHINVRVESSGNVPTLEIGRIDKKNRDEKKIKIRYQ